LAARAEIGHHPVQPDQVERALDEPYRLSHNHAEQNLHRLAGLFGSVATYMQSAALTNRYSFPDHL
jgi:hypothetical protein